MAVKILNEKVHDSFEFSFIDINYGCYLVKNGNEFIPSLTQILRMVGLYANDYIFACI